MRRPSEGPNFVKTFAKLGCHLWSRAASGRGAQCHRECPGANTASVTVNTSAHGHAGHSFCSVRYLQFWVYFYISAT